VDEDYIILIILVDSGNRLYNFNYFGERMFSLRNGHFYAFVLNYTQLAEGTGVSRGKKS